MDAKIFVSTFHMEGFPNCIYNSDAVTISLKCSSAAACCSSTIVIRAPRAKLSRPLASRKNPLVLRLYSPRDLLKCKFIDRGIADGKTLSTDQHLPYSFRDRGRFVRYDVTSFELLNSLGHVANIDGNYR